LALQITFPVPDRNNSAIPDLMNLHDTNFSAVAELFDGERQRFFIDLEAKVNLSAFDLFLASTPGSHQHKVLIPTISKKRSPFQSFQ
jgi:hypothetical protein